MRGPMTPVGHDGPPRILLAALLLLSLLLVAVPAAAQGKNGQVFEDWTITCIADPDNELGQLCSASHRTINDQTQKPVLEIQVGFPPDGTPARAVIRVPLVVLLEPGLRLQVDEGDPRVFPYEICRPRGCEVYLQMDQALYAAMSSGAAGKVTVRVLPGQNVTVPFSLKGFTAALSSLK